MRISRSILSIPASNSRMIEKGLASDADIAFLDLEDAVAPNVSRPSKPCYMPIGRGNHEQSASIQLAASFSPGISSISSSRPGSSLT